MPKNIKDVKLPKHSTWVFNLYIDMESSVGFSLEALRSYMDITGLKISSFFIDLMMDMKRIHNGN